MLWAHSVRSFPSTRWLRVLSWPHPLVLSSRSRGVLERPNGVSLTTVPFAPQINCWLGENDRFVPTTDRNLDHARATIVQELRTAIEDMVLGGKNVD